MDDLNRKPSPQARHAGLEEIEAGRSDKRGRDAQRKQALDDNLERGLEGSFPASDPVAATQPARSLHDRYKP
jgi:hypothetical protein